MGWPHPKICSYFSSMTCHVLVIPLSECQKIRRPSRVTPCVNKNPPLTTLLKKLFQRVFAGQCEWFEVLHVSPLCGWSVWVVSTGRHHQSSVQFFGTQKGSNLLFRLFTQMPTPHLVCFVGKEMEPDLVPGTSWQYSSTVLTQLSKQLPGAQTSKLGSATCDTHRAAWFRSEAEKLLCKQIVLRGQVFIIKLFFSDRTTYHINRKKFRGKTNFWQELCFFYCRAVHLTSKWNVILLSLEEKCGFEKYEFEGMYGTRASSREIPCWEETWSWWFWFGNFTARGNIIWMGNIILMVCIFLKRNILPGKRAGTIEGLADMHGPMRSRAASLRICSECCWAALTVRSVQWKEEQAWVLWG